jgi:hypothetical protein
MPVAAAVRQRRVAGQDVGGAKQACVRACVRAQQSPSRKSVR